MFYIKSFPLKIAIDNNIFFRKSNIGFKLEIINYLTV